MLGFLKKYNYVLWLYLLTSIIFLISEVSAGQIFDKCYVGFNFGINYESKNMQLTYSDPKCDKECLNRCAVFSRIGGYNKEVNTGVISRCLNACRSGKTFTSYYEYEQAYTDSNTTTPITKYKTYASDYPLTVTPVCNGKEGYYYKQDDDFARAYDTALTIDRKKDITMHLLDDEISNIYMCGYSFNKIRPVFDSNKTIDWKNKEGTKLQCLWGSGSSCQALEQSEHKCLQALQGNNYSKITLQELWKKNNKFIDDGSVVDKTHQCYWNARNSDFTKTGVFLRKGDYFSISWYGDYGVANPSLLSYLNDAFKHLANDVRDDCDYNAENDDSIAAAMINSLSKLNKGATKNRYAELFHNMQYSNDGVGRSKDVSCQIESWWQDNSKLDISFDKNGRNFYTLGGEENRYFPDVNRHGNFFNSTISPSTYTKNNCTQDYDSLLSNVSCVSANKCINADEIIEDGVIGCSGNKIPKDQCIYKKNAVDYRVDDLGYDIKVCNAKKSYCPNNMCYIIKDAGTSVYSATVFQADTIGEASKKAVQKNCPGSAKKNGNPLVTTNEPQELLLRHHTPKGYARSKNIGGFAAEVEWGGCPHRNFDGLQYRIKSQPNEPSYDSGWKNINRGINSCYEACRERCGDTNGSGGKKYDKCIDKCGGKYHKENDDSYRRICISGEGKGKLYLRISSQGDENVNPANVFGSYNYKIVSKVSGFSASAKGPFSLLEGVLEFVYDIIAGKNLKPGQTCNGRIPNSEEVASNRCKGVLYNIYYDFVNNKGFLQVARAMILLWLIVYAVSFTIGTAKINQDELVKNSFKLIFVAVMISPQILNTVNDYLVPFFIDGSMYLVAVGVSSLGQIVGEGITLDYLIQHPASIVRVFDNFFGILFSKVIWVKIGALFFHSVISFVVMIICICSCFYFFLAIVKAVIMYIYAILGLAFLLTLGPLFSVLILFKKTKHIFDSWWKYLLSYAVQPMALFVWMVLIGNMVLYLFMAMLGFTACQKCVLWIGIPGILETCFINGYRLVASMFNSSVSFTNVPVVMHLSLALTMLLLCLSAFKMPSLLMDIISRVMTGSPIRNATIGGAMDGIERAASPYAQQGKAILKQGVKGAGKKVGKAVGKRVKRGVKSFVGRKNK